jgi:hypothetical protein
MKCGRFGRWMASNDMELRRGRDVGIVGSHLKTVQSEEAIFESFKLASCQLRANDRWLLGLETITAPQVYTA